MTSIEIAYDPSPEFAVSVYRTLLWKRYAEYIICSILIAGIAIVCLLARSGVGFWAFWLGVVTTFWYGWWEGVRRTRMTATRRDPVTVHLLADVTGCTLRTESATQWFRWGEVEELEQLTQALVIRRRNGMHPIPVPMSVLREDVIATMTQWARESGAQVR